VTALVRLGFLGVVAARSCDEGTVEVTERGRAYAVLMDPDAVRWVRQSAFDGWAKSGSWTPIPEIAAEAARETKGFGVRQMANQFDRGGLGYVDPSTHPRRRFQGCGLDRSSASLSSARPERR
jgi:hypothetical protein